MLLIVGGVLGGAASPSPGEIDLRCDVASDYSTLHDGYTMEETMAVDPTRRRVVWLSTGLYVDGEPEPNPSLPGYTEYVIVTGISIAFGDEKPDGTEVNATLIDRRTGEMTRSNGAAPVRVGQCHLITARAF